MRRIRCRFSRDAHSCEVLFFNATFRISSKKGRFDMAKSQLTPNVEFSHVASDERITKTAEALTANGMQTFVVANAEEARKKVFELIPKDAEVFTATSRTLEQIGA